MILIEEHTNKENARELMIRLYGTDNVLKDFQQVFDSYSFVYKIENEKMLAITFTADAEPICEGYSYAFAGLISKLKESSFNQCLLLSSLYYKQTSEQLCALLNKINHFVANSFWDEWLSNSFGILLYHHQLEQIYSMLTGASYTDAIDFRKQWNKKTIESREIASSIPVDKDKTLASFIESRTADYNSFTYSANFQGAYNLMVSPEKEVYIEAN